MKKTYSVPKVRVVTFSTGSILAGSAQMEYSDAPAQHGGEEEVLSKRGRQFDWFED